jgi:hypothetical protein
MAYHELFNMTFKPELKDDKFRTGWYEFYHKGAIIRGNVYAVGDEKVFVDSPMMGKFQVNMLEFVSNNPVKL